MPFKSLKKYAGMKSGGKVRRFQDGGESYNDSRPFAETNASEDLPVTRIVSGFAPSKSRGSADFNAAYRQAVIDSKTSGAKTFDYGGKQIAIESPKPISSSTVTADENVATPAVTGRADKVSKNMPSAAQKEENTERLGAGMLAAASLLPAGRATKVASTLNAERLRRAEQLSSMAERKAMLANRRSERQRADVNEAFVGKRRGNEYAKGGNVKRYVEGGSIRGGGIEQRGKTKGRMV
jgi:hypothetical protein